MLIEHAGRTYSTVRGSDLARDGMFLELSVAGSSEVLMEIFYSSVDGSFSLSSFGAQVPLEVAEALIAGARELLVQRPEQIS
ncbi:hypothetical protein [Haloferula sp. BvORR071]|uniref:hypothetical protein n=1 Tax=Haloferula sp. BvORR071 TaxID=1396141 RepID=UPI000695C788|nr:hypothetical protein [Haloferula sp. BvORR071]